MSLHLPSAGQTYDVVDSAHAVDGHAYAHDFGGVKRSYGSPASTAEGDDGDDEHAPSVASANDESGAKAMARSRRRTTKE